jgi:hypothetical protein
VVESELIKQQDSSRTNQRPTAKKQLHAFSDVDIPAGTALAVIRGASFARLLTGQKAALAGTLGIALTMILHKITILLKGDNYSPEIQVTPKTNAGLYPQNPVWQEITGNIPADFSNFALFCPSSSR